MKFELDYLEKLMQMLNENGLSEIVLEDGDKSVLLKKELFATPVPMNSQPTSCSPVVNVNTKEIELQEKKIDTRKSITSPMVGTFYKSPSPESAAFVTLGDTVATGQVVCIVEAMKLMNEIEADVSGRVVEICVEDGQPVEFGQVLMYVE